MSERFASCRSDIRWPASTRSGARAVLPRVLALMLVSLVLMYPAKAETPAKSPELKTDIRAAAASDGRLWIIDSKHALQSIDLSDGTREVHLSDGALDLGLADGHLWILVAETGSQLSVREWARSAFKYLPTLKIDREDRSAGLLVIGTHIGVVTEYGFYLWKAGHWRKTRIGSPPAIGSRSFRSVFSLLVPQTRCRPFILEQMRVNGVVRLRASILGAISFPAYAVTAARDPEVDYSHVGSAL